MNIWNEVVWVAFDTETTGVEVEVDRIVACCIGISSSEHDWNPRRWLINPGIAIPKTATNIHGITTEQAREGADPKTALQEIRDMIVTGWCHDWVLTGYNVPYDLTILDRELRRYDLAPLDRIGPVVDPLVIDKEIDARRGSRQLADVADHWRVPMKRAHAADADAFATMQLARMFAAYLPTVPGDWQATVTKTMTWQAAAYRKQHLSLAHYFRTVKGDEQTAARIETDTDWPIRPWNDEHHRRDRQAVRPHVRRICTHRPGNGE